MSLEIRTILPTQIEHVGSLPNLLPDPQREAWVSLLRCGPIDETVFVASGLFSPTNSYLCLEDRDKTAVIVAYKGYRIFPYGDEELLHRGFAWMEKHPTALGFHDASELPNTLTIVSPKTRPFIPPGYRSKSPPEYYKRMTAVLPLKKYPGQLSGNYSVRLLDIRDRGDIDKLLRPPEGIDADTFTDGVRFDAKKLQYGLPYMGLFLQRRLISIVGTHGITSEIAIATIGDAFTKREFRRQGLGTTVTHALLVHLHDTYGTKLVGADIRDDKPGWRILRKLGFGVWKNRIAYQEIERTSTTS